MKKRTLSKIVSALILLAVLFSAFSGVHVFAEGAADEIYGEGYERLSEELLTQISQDPGTTAYVLTDAESREQAKKLSYDIQYGHPEYFYLDFGYGTFGDDYVVTASVKAEFEGTDLEKTKNEFDALCEELYALRGEDWSDFETALFYHDRFASNYEYDLTYSIYDAYGFLKNKTGVCQAYTLTYSMVMNHFGIPCTYVISEDMNHVWNAVKIGGVWYHTDVTHDDPVYDRPGSDRPGSERPGSARHEHFLVGNVTCEEQKPDAGDMTPGGIIRISENDHPTAALLSQMTAPVVEAGGKFYGITVSSNAASLCELKFETATFTALKSLPTKWYVVGGGAYYSGNYSTLATNGIELYYFDSSSVYAFNITTGEERKLASCDDTTRLYGLQFDDGVLTAYTAAAPGVAEYTPLLIDNNVPQYYTVRWIVGDVILTTFAKEGSNPETTFNGSTERESSGGIEYTFAGWSPEISPVTGDVTYTAMYFEKKLYMAGDIDGNGEVTIGDVTALLDYLAGAKVTVVEEALDTNGDRSITIADVTALLDYLSDRSNQIF